jgi:serine phosphatase RsbU (regulator of sigma subunit)/anti-sigma regulatory factor (Ser/Thr protein kinase)
MIRQWIQSLLKDNFVIKWFFHSNQRTYQIEINSDDREIFEVKNFLDRICDLAGCTSREASNIKLSVDEACTNIIRHSYQNNTTGKIKIEVGVGLKAITIKIIDHGTSFELNRIKEPDLDKYVRDGKKGGLGLWIIRKMMNHISYRAYGDRNELTLVKILSKSIPKISSVQAHAVPISVKFTSGAILITIIIVISVFLMLSHRQKAFFIAQQNERAREITLAISTSSGEEVVKKSDLQLNQFIRNFISGDTTHVLSYIFIVSAHQRYLADSNLEDIFQKYHRPQGQNPVTLGLRIYHVGSVLEYVMPIFFQNKYVGEVHVGLSEKRIGQLLNQAEFRLKWIFAGILLIATFLIYFISKKITGPIEKIFAGVQAIASGDYSVKIDLNTQDEFGQLASIFNQMTNQIRDSQKGLMEQERMQKEMQVAQEIQHTLLPAQFPEVKGYEIGAMYRAAKEVGGDYYDFFWVDPTTLGIVVADVSGKGVPGSLVMTMIRTAMRLEARNNKSAAEVLSRVNQHVTSDMKHGMFVTMCYIILDSINRVINFSSAGHNPIILYRRKTQGIYFLKPQGFPVGLDLPEDNVFEKTLSLQKVSLEQGDMLVIYTDGITEAMNVNKQQFGEERLIATIKENSHLNPKEFIDELNRRISEFTQGAEQHDDITVVVIKEKMKAQTVVFQFKKKLITMVQEGESVTEACRKMNVSPSAYYRYKKLFDQYGEAGLKQTDRHRRMMTELTNDQKMAVLKLVKEFPQYGPTRIAGMLKTRSELPMTLDPKQIYIYLKRRNLNSVKARQEFATNPVDSFRL